MIQLALWPEGKPEVMQTLIEVYYRDGKRRILDTSKPEDREAFDDMQVVYAGFVYKEASK